MSSVRPEQLKQRCTKEDTNLSEDVEHDYQSSEIPNLIVLGSPLLIIYEYDILLTRNAYTLFPYNLVIIDAAGISEISNKNESIQGKCMIAY